MKLHFYLRHVLVCLVYALPAMVAHAQVPEFVMDNASTNVCQGILYDSGGEDGIYTNNENYTFVINPGQGVISISFINQFCLENNLDFVNVYNGPSAASPLLGSFTGSALPPAITANSGAVTVVMTTDNNVAYCGFSLAWTTDAPNPVPPALAINVMPNCNTANLTVSLSPTVPCTYLAGSTWYVVVNGQTVAVNTATPACNGGNASSVVLALASPFTFNCDYTVHAHLEIPDACQVLHPFDVETTFTYDNCGVQAQLVAAQNPICPGGNTTIQAQVTGCYTYTYAWNQGLPPTAGPHTVSPAANTTYTCTITEVATGNVVTKSITVNIENINILTPAQTVCQSVDDIVMTALGSGVWSGDGIEFQTNRFDPDTAGAGLSYVYFQTASCIDSMAITVTPIQTETVTAACPGSAPFQLNATPAGGTWSGLFTTPTGMFDPSTAGSYTVTYAVNGCVDSLDVNVDFIGNAVLDPICQSIELAQINFSPIGGVWSGNGIVDPYSGLYSPAQMPVGNQQFTYTINGCSQNFTVLIKEIYIGGTYHTSCPDEEPLVWYNPTPLPTGGTWIGEGIVNASTGLFDPGLIANNTTTFFYYNAPNGCSDTTYVFNFRTAVAVDELSFCINEPAYALNAENLESIEPSNGEWSGAGVTEPTADNFIFSPANAGVGEHTIYYERNNCQDSIVVTVFPTALNVSSLSYCANEDPLLLQSDLQPGGTWSGSGIVDAATGLFDAGAATPGNFYVYWESGAGCSDSIAMLVEPFEQASLSGLNDTYCVIDQVYNFSGSPAGGNLTGSLPDFTLNPSVIGEGNYQVIYTYTGTLCPATADTVDFVVYPPLVTSIAISDELICDGQSTTITVTATGGNPAGNFNFTWSNGGLSTNVNTSQPAQTTTIYVTTNDGCGAPILDSAFIEVLPPLTVTSTTSPPLCFGEPGFASVDVLTAGSYSYEWNGTAGEELEESTAGASLTVEITDLVNGCAWDSVILVPSHPLVVANFNINPAVSCISLSDAAGVSFIDLSQNATTGYWDFGSGPPAPYVAGQTISYAFGGAGNTTITLHVSNAFGCTDSLAKILCILPDEPVFIPDIFSPNDDGRNDILYVRGIGFEKMEFSIYNRWGEEVFYSNNIAKGWDGNWRGRPALSGSYFYSFKTTVGGSTKIEMVGEIALIR